MGASNDVWKKVVLGLDCGKENQGDFVRERLLRFYCDTQIA